MRDSWVQIIGFLALLLVSVLSQERASRKKQKVRQALTPPPGPRRGNDPFENPMGPRGEPVDSTEDEPEFEQTESRVDPPKSRPQARQRREDELLRQLQERLFGIPAAVKTVPLTQETRTPPPRALEILDVPRSKSLESLQPQQALSSPSTARPSRGRTRLGSRSALRRAVILREVLGPPRGMDPR